MARRLPPSGGGSLSRFQLLCYTLPGVPVAMMMYAVGVIVPGYYAGTIGVGTATVGIMLMLTRLVDVLFDFGAGAASDMTRSRFGRRKPWLAAGAVIIAVGFAILMLPPAGAGGAYLFWASIAFSVGWSLCTVPYDAWGSELAGGYQARSFLFSCRAGASYLGSILFCLIPILPIFKTSEFSPETLRFSVFAVGAILAITVPIALVAAPGEVQVFRKRQTITALRNALRSNRPLRLYAGAAVANGLSDGIFSAVVFIYQAQYMGFAKSFWLILIVYTAANLVTLPLWNMVVKRIGRHRAWALGLALTAICYPPMALLAPGAASLPAMLVLIALAGGTYSIANVAMPAVLGDVADYEMLRARTNATGGLFAVQALISKFNLAVGTGIAFLLIAWFGYSGPESLHDPMAAAGLKFTHLFLPSILKFVAIALLWRFPLDARVQSVIRRRLDQLALRHV